MPFILNEEKALKALLTGLKVSDSGKAERPEIGRAHFPTRRSSDLCVILSQELGINNAVYSQ